MIVPQIEKLEYFLSLILLAGLGRTYQRNFDWQDGRTLNEKTLATVPLNIRVHLDVAFDLIRQGRLSSAKPHLEKILEIAQGSANLTPEFQNAQQLLKQVNEQLMIND